MARIVVAYPEISAADFDWIQEYRHRNDPRYFRLIDPHFTLVFPVQDVPEEEFCGEIRKQAAGVSRIVFELRVATINRDLTGNYYHEFLVPDAGYAALVILHDKLYSGILAAHLRLDVDFIPHIGIGNTEEPLVAKRNVDALNARSVHIAGTITALDIVEYADGRIRPIERVELRPSARPPLGHRPSALCLQILACQLRAVRNCMAVAKPWTVYWHTPLIGGGR